MSLTSDIRVAMAAALSEHLDQSVWNTITPWMQVPPVPPQIEIFPKRTPFDEGAFTDKLRFTIRVIVGSTLSSAAQQMLDSLIDPSGNDQDSIKAILEAEDGGVVLIREDNDLAGLVQDVYVEEHGDYHSYPIVGSEGHVLGCEVTVCVVTTRPTPT